MKKIIVLSLFGLLPVMGQIISITGNDPHFMSTPPLEGDNHTFSNGLQVVQKLAPPLLGQPVTWTTHVTNSSTTAQTFRFTQGIGKFFYNGDYDGPMTSVVTTNTLLAAGHTNIIVTIGPTTYLPWQYDSSHFRYNTLMESNNEYWLIVRQAFLDVADDILTLHPTQPTLHIGQTVTARVNFVNPLPIPLQNVAVEIAGMWGFSKDGEDVVAKWQLGTIQPNAVIHAEKTFAAQKLANASIIGFIRSDELNVLRHDMQIDIVE